jgi:hypothetical protein
MWLWVFVFVAAASVWFVFSANPEEMVVRSEDGVVTVTGVFSKASPSPFIAGGGLTNTIFFGQSYRFEPMTMVLAKPVLLTWQLAPVVDAGGVTEGLAVYRFNEDSLMWEVVSPVVAADGTMLAVATTVFGVFALGKKEAVTVPEFVEVYKDILVAKPVGAVGFVTTVGYSKAGVGSTIKLPSVGQQGGCGGAVQPGVSEQKSSVTRDVVLLVDDVQTKLTLTFFTRWFMASGCSVNAAFQSSTNYGTLPLSN